MTPKLVIYRFLLFAAVFVLPVAVCAQSNQELFEQKYLEAQERLYDDPHKAVELGMEAYNFAKDAGDFWAMAIANMGIGFMSYELGEYKTAYTNYSTALRVLKRADTTDLYHEMLILSELAMIQSDFNNHDGAIDYYARALERAKDYVRKYPEHALENDQQSWLIEIPFYMAVAFQDKGAHQTAGKILFDLWEKAENKNNVVAYAQVLNELGLIKSNNGEYSEAQEYFGLVVSSAEVDQYYKTLAYHNLAGTYLNQGDLEKAKSYFLIALDLADDLEDAKSKFVTYLDLGELEYRSNNFSQAIDYWETALNTYSDIETDPDLYGIYNWLQRAYMDIDINLAKEYNQKYTQLNDFYVKNQNVQRELEAQNRQQLSMWIDEQRQERINAEEKMRFLQQFWPVLLGVALLVLFSFIMGVRYYMALRTNKMLMRNRLAEQLVEK